MSWRNIKRLIEENAGEIIKENEGPKILNAENLNGYCYLSPYHSKKVAKELAADKEKKRKAGAE